MRARRKSEALGDQKCPLQHGMTPSFFALFKRGKYFHPAPLPTTDKKLARVRGSTREAERFAAAAIAFAWQHHPPIRQHFWKKICWFPGDPPLSSDAKILVEPERWADLLIVNPVEKQRFVYTIECKIHAGLDKYQDPSRRAFGQIGGYGRLLTASDTGVWPILQRFAGDAVRPRWAPGHYAAALVTKSTAQVSISKRRSSWGSAVICARSSARISRQEGREQGRAHFGGGR